MKAFSLRDCIETKSNAVRTTHSDGSFVNLLNQEMEELLAKDKYDKIKNHPASEIVILTKDEFHSMIKTDKEAKEYGQQCRNDGKAQGVREFANFLKSFMGIERDYVGIKYKQGVFTEYEIDDLVEEFNNMKEETNETL